MNNKDKMKATPKYDKDLKMFIVIVDAYGDKLPLGHTVSRLGEVPIFRHLVFDTRDMAIDYINNNPRLILNNDN